MKMKSSFINTIIASTLLFAATGCQQDKNITMTSMKCEFVNAGDEAIIYGSGFSADDEILFENGKKGQIVADKTSDSVLTVIVPEGVKPGMLTYVPKHGKKVTSDFMFLDNRNMIIDFSEEYRASWGGFDSYDEEGDPIKFVKGDGDSILMLPVTPPDEISGHYGLLYGIYKEAWSMKRETFLQYCAREDFGGRGDHSIAGKYEDMPLDQLCLKFEVYVPKECPFKCQPRVEIFFGPYDAANKHGREQSPIYAWDPRNSETGVFHTDNKWQTIIIPLTLFNRSYESDAIEAGPINLKTATNMTFVLVGDAATPPTENFICVDNFRVVPIK